MTFADVHTPTLPPMKLALASIALGTLCALPQTGAAETSAEMMAVTAKVAGTSGESLGTVMLSETASGVIEVNLDLTELPEGEHAVHVHETGDCSASDFKSAGGHLTGGMEHGAYVEGGMHSGDLPNIHVGADGAAKVTYFSQNLSLDQVMDEDGSAFVIHDGADDYHSQPSGDAGSRIGCGVFEAS